MAAIITHTKNWLHDAHKVRHLSIIIPAPNWEGPHILWENLEAMSIFPVLPSILPWREYSYAALVLFQSCWSRLLTLPITKYSELLLGLNDLIHHFACAPLPSFYNRHWCSFMTTNMLAEILLLRVKHLHICFSQCHCPFLSLLTQVLSFVDFLYSVFGSTFFVSDHLPFKE